MILDFNLAATPCCGIVTRFLDTEYLEKSEAEIERAERLLENGFCPDCYRDMNELPDKLKNLIRFRPNIGNEIPARWDYSMASKVFEATYRAQNLVIDTLHSVYCRDARATEYELELV
jgi:hypothetical protein